MSLDDLEFGLERRVISRCPSGMVATVLGRLSEMQAKKRRSPLIHVALNDEEAEQVLAALTFFAPLVRPISFPAWDCLPYDRVSPKVDILTKRVDALTQLADIQQSGISQPVVVITTINAVLQRVPPATIFRDASLVIKTDQEIAQSTITNFLAGNGYTRADTVREPGEFAIRGGLIDIYPTGADYPVRIDFFGDTVDSIRTFDATDQKTIGQRQSVIFKPVSEVFLTDAAIKRFRSNYRERFGTGARDDPLYESIRHGRPHPGMEHFLPLFYDDMATVFDYAPKAGVSFTHQAEAAINSRLDQIFDFYQARQASTSEYGLDSYHPLPPSMLYLSVEDLDQALENRLIRDLSPYKIDADAMGDQMVEDAGGNRAPDFATARNHPDQTIYDQLSDILVRQERSVLITAYSDGSRDRLSTLLSEHNIRHQMVDELADLDKLPNATVGLTQLRMDSGYKSDETVIISEQDFLGDRMIRRSRRAKKSDDFITELSALSEGDLVVHSEHGVGRFLGLEKITAAKAPHDCLKLEYHGGDRLFLPVESLELLSKFGGENTTASLDKLGSASWQKRKAKVKKDLLAMADDLIDVAAERQLRSTEPITPPAAAYHEFCARFPYPETEDQERAITDVLSDLASGTPMDRLICGDVGFGKTEVALRAAFAVAMAGKQVAMVVPTTLLARQHTETFKQRFAGMPVNIVQLSRFVTASKARRHKENITNGQVDIVIGTHALLAESVDFSDLGLIIVDEEQKFGVKQKERLKSIAKTAHVLTLTATPIPRTLQQSMTGIRDLSIIATPPVDRLAVRTFVLPFDHVVVREAISREYYRGGQCFYVCPRVKDIKRLEKRLDNLVPEVSYISAHGGLSANELDDRMTAFYDGKFQVLIATNIIESGLDIPNANTLIVHRANMFGLAQLYQIRGRIGRSKKRGYAYLTYPQHKMLSDRAEERLHVIETLDNLGAGFQLASHDMDIRGAGNLLGEQQSGHIKEVGNELYQKMLKDAIDQRKAERGRKDDKDEAGGDDAAKAVSADWAPEINLGLPVLIPDDYVGNLNVRLSLYRRMSNLTSKDEIDGMAAELVDRFGALPAEVENLLNIMWLKHLCRQAGVSRVDAGKKGAVIHFRNDRFSNVDKLVEFISDHIGRMRLRPDHTLSYQESWDGQETRFDGVKSLVQKLAKMAA
jgi:transcription-repair coupling factor (superfamily II helicase)